MKLVGRKTLLTTDYFCLASIGYQPKCHKGMLSLVGPRLKFAKRHFLRHRFLKLGPWRLLVKSCSQSSSMRNTVIIIMQIVKIST